MSQRRVAACMMTVAVAVFLALVEKPSAKGCQEECDADVASCQWYCSNDVNVATACGDSEVCYNDCHSACTTEFNHCSVNRMTCGSPFTGACDVVYYRGWDLGDSWVQVFDPENPEANNFTLRCLSYQ